MTFDAGNKGFGVVCVCWGGGGSIKITYFRREDKLHGLTEVYCIWKRVMSLDITSF